MQTLNSTSHFALFAELASDLVRRSAALLGAELHLLLAGLEEVATAEELHLVLRRRGALCQRFEALEAVGLELGQHALRSLRAFFGAGSEGNANDDGQGNGAEERTGRHLLAFLGTERFATHVPGYATLDPACLHGVLERLDPRFTR
ncbi:MAG: hypothetical protein HOV80_39755 [Polyangiaceae bacterium]|nr:hypothetical protein [Polyangiaceae bacterium]